LHKAARHQYDVCYDLVSELRKLEEEASHRNNESYKHGQVTLADLLARLSDGVVKLDTFTGPVNKQLHLARKSHQAQHALKLRARWSLVKEWESVGLPKHSLNLLLELKLVSEEDDGRSSARACKDTTVPQSKTWSDEHCETSPCLASDDLKDTQLATETADITSSVVNEGIASDSCAQAAISTFDGAPSTPASPLTAGVLVVASKSVPKYSLVHYKTNVAENFNAVHQWWKMITFWAPQTCHPDKDAVATSIASLNGSEARINTAAETLTIF